MYAPTGLAIPRNVSEVHAFADTHATGESAHSGFNRRFHNAIAGIQPGEIMNWQDYFFLPAVEAFAQPLRDNGVFQSFHLHTALPESLDQSEWGRKAITAMALVDVVLVHTDTYAKRLSEQFKRLGIEAPEIRRFDLGIDLEGIDKSISEINPGNYTSKVQGFLALPKQTQEFIDEVFRTTESIPHRFMSIDRIDPQKGSLTVLRGIEEFLESRTALGATMIDLRNNFRFFLLNSGLNRDLSAAEPHDITSNYTRAYQREVARVCSKFPGIVFCSDAVSGSARDVVPALLRGTHGITGGAQDGLNLAIMEDIYANRDADVGFIAGSGAGFAMRMAEQRLNDSTFFRPANSSQQFASAIQEIVHLKESAPSILQSRKAPFVTEIIKRKSRMAVSS
jgi:trehalose-6-phosphate synthase